MLLPIGDAPNPPGYHPWVSWGLIVVNVLVYATLTLPLSSTPADPSDPAFQEWMEVLQGFAPGLSEEALMAQVSAWDLFVFRFGFRPDAPSIFTLFSSMFMHAGLLHLLGNMLFLWIYGNNIEHRLGRIPALVAYLLTGALATAAYAMITSSPELPLVGASGAISGLLGLYFVLFPHNTVRLMVFFFPLLFRVFDVSARFVLLGYLLFDNMLPMMLSEDGTGGDGVAHGAHLGGFVAGLGLGGIVWLSGFGLDPGQSRVGRNVNGESRARQLFDFAQHNIRSGQTSTAYQQLREAQAAGPDRETAQRIAFVLDDLKESPVFRRGRR